MRIGVLGAGAIGCYVGGRLAAAGGDVRLVGRQSLVDDVGRGGLALSDCDGFRQTVTLAPGRLDVRSAVDALADCDVVLVTVKSRDSETAGKELRGHVKPGALVVSLQNG